MRIIIPKVSKLIISRLVGNCNLDKIALVIYIEELLNPECRK